MEESPAAMPGLSSTPPRLESRETFIPGRAYERLCGRVPVSADDHRSTFELLEIFAFDEVERVVPSERREALSPRHLRTLALDSAIYKETTMAIQLLKRLAPVAAYIQETNTFDLRATIETFAEEALVNDAQREFWGKAAIAKFLEREIIGRKVTMDVTSVVEHYGNVIVSVNVTRDERSSVRNERYPTVCALC